MRPLDIKIEASAFCCFVFVASNRLFTFIDYIERQEVRESRRVTMRQDLHGQIFNIDLQLTILKSFLRATHICGKKIVQF